MARDTKRYGIPHPVPQTICLDENYDGVTNFAANIRSNLIRNTDAGPVTMDFTDLKRSFRFHNSYADFGQIKNLTPAAALLIAAEYDRNRRISGLPLYTIDLDTWDPGVRVFLHQLGFLKLLNVAEDEIPESVSTGPITVLAFTSGRKAEGAKATEIIAALNPLFGAIDEHMALRDCIVEAMSNVTRHAYPKDHDYTYPPGDRRWWLTGSYDSESKKLSIVFVDLGITIPVSLPRSDIGAKAFDYLKKVFSIVPKIDDFGYDAEQIQAATHASRTSKNAAGEGLGLAEMKDFIDDSSNGRLRVLSRRGEYVYEKDKGESVINHGVSIGGTLIEWEIWR